MKLPPYFILALLIAAMIISGYAGWQLRGSKTEQVQSVPFRFNYDTPDTTFLYTTTLVERPDTTTNVRAFDFAVSKDSTWRVEGIVWSPSPPEKVAITKLTFTGKAQAILDQTAGLRFNPITPSLEITTPAGSLKAPKERWLSVMLGIGGSVYPLEKVYPMIFGGFQIKNWYIGAYWSHAVGVQVGVRL
jgi:hypothetical protein